MDLRSRSDSVATCPGESPLGQVELATQKHHATRISSGQSSARRGARRQFSPEGYPLNMKPEPRAADVEQDEPTEYDRFQDLARKLISVPKSEIDEARHPKPA